MPRYLVRRTKVYNAYVDATDSDDAIEIAEELPGKAWMLSSDYLAKATLIEDEEAQRS